MDQSTIQKVGNVVTQMAKKVALDGVRPIIDRGFPSAFEVGKEYDVLLLPESFSENLVHSTRADFGPTGQDFGSFNVRYLFNGQTQRNPLNLSVTDGFAYYLGLKNGKLSEATQFKLRVVQGNPRSNGRPAIPKGELYVNGQSLGGLFPSVSFNDFIEKKKESGSFGKVNNPKDPAKDQQDQQKEKEQTVVY